MIRLEDLGTIRPAFSRQHVYIDGKRYIIISADTLEGLAYDAPGSIAMPPTEAGWATTTVGSTRFAAWFGGAA